MTGMSKGRKTAAALLALVTIMALLAGCGSSENNIGSGAKDQIASGSQSGSGNQGSSGTENQGGQNGTQKGYVFTYKDVTISMDAEAAPLVAALGEPNSYFEAASCAFEGLDKMYTYSGFELDTYPTGDKDFVSAVVLKDDSVATPEGVVIGDSKSKLESVYGTASSTTDTLAVYEKDGMELRFILSGDSIVSIEYMSGAALQ